MQENYFTGDFKNTNASGQNTSGPAQQHPEQMKQTTMQEQMKNMTVNEKNIQAALSQQDENDNFVDAKEIVVEKRQIEEQKFIESNPSLAAEQKQLGNQKYTSGQYAEALVFYRKSLQYTDQLSEEDKKFRSIIYSNIGLTYMKMQQQENAIEYFQNSLKLNQKYSKARINLALCYEKQQKIEEALEQYKKVLEISPDDKFVKQQIVALQIKVRELQQKRKQQVLGGLKNIGNSILGYFGMSLDNFKMQKGPGGGYNISFKQ